ncbi:putative leucine-rich repeat domain superfamily [Dioscorea sansibarensis]
MRICATNNYNRGLSHNFLLFLYFLFPSEKLLNVLEILGSEMSSVTLEKHAKSFSLLTFLDIRYYLTINASSIEVFGNNCKCLVHQKRNMSPLKDKLSFEDEAQAIGNTMPNLEHLELVFSSFSEVGLDSILTNGKVVLKRLDTCGCRDKSLGPVWPKCVSIRSIRDPDEEDNDAFLTDQSNQVTNNDSSDK